MHNRFESKRTLHQKHNPSLIVRDLHNQLCFDTKLEDFLCSRPSPHQKRANILFSYKIHCSKIAILSTKCSQKSVYQASGFDRGNPTSEQKLVSWNRFPVYIYNS